MGEATIPIEQSRYEELLDIETRVNVFVDHMRNNGCVSMETAYRILGYKKEADELKAKFEKEQEEYLKKYGEKMEIDE